MRGHPASFCSLKDGINGTHEHIHFDFPELGIRGPPPSQALLNVAGAQGMTQLPSHTTGPPKAPRPAPCDHLGKQSVDGKQCSCSPCSFHVSL